MSHRLSGVVALFAALMLGGNLARSNEYLYQDDDLLCRSGWSPDLYYERIQQDAYQQRVSYFESQQAMAREAVSEQKRQEKVRTARRVRAEKQARRRDETIAKRKASTANLTPDVALTANKKR